MTGGTGSIKRHQEGREPGRGPRAWRDRWRAATPSQTPSSRQKTPLVLPRTLSGERRKGLGFAQPPEPGPLPRRGQGLAHHPGTGPLPRRARVSPNIRIQVLSLAGGRRSSSGERQRGSRDAGILRFPHRLNASIGLRQSIVIRPASPHNPWSRPPNPSGKREHRQESANTGKPKQTRPEDSRPRWERSRCLGAQPVPGSTAGA